MSLRLSDFRINSITANVRFSVGFSMCPNYQCQHVVLAYTGIYKFHLILFKNQTTSIFEGMPKIS